MPANTPLPPAEVHLGSAILVNVDRRYALQFSAGDGHLQVRVAATPAFVGGKNWRCTLGADDLLGALARTFVNPAFDDGEVDSWRRQFSSLSYGRVIVFHRPRLSPPVPDAPSMPFLIAEHELIKLGLTEDYAANAL